jgi:hypothetical protein
VKTASTPMTDLRRLAERQATGEFICTAAEVEIHAYLQNGRIAWATSSAHPLEFARYIQERGQIDDVTFRQVLDECRREKLPFGETLIAWGVVSTADVLAALRHQVGLALRALAAIPSGPSIFLERRRFTEYSPALTLDFSSVDVAPARAVSAPEREARATSETSAAANQAGPAPAAHDPTLARRLFDGVSGLAWVQVIDGERVLEVLPGPDAVPHIPPALLGRSLADGADFVAIRSESLTLMGLRAAGQGASLWCALVSYGAYGVLLSKLAALGMVRGPDATASGVAAEHVGSGAPWLIGCHAPPIVAELAQVLEFSRDVLAAVVLSGDGEPVVGMGKAAIEPDVCVALLRRRAPLFDVALPREERGASHGRLGFGGRAAVTGEPAFWCFGTELLGDAGQTLWVLTARGARQGLGWACLTALFRGLGRNEYVNEGRAP